MGEPDYGSQTARIQLTNIVMGFLEKYQTLFFPTLKLQTSHERKRLAEHFIGAGIQRERSNYPLLTKHFKQMKQCVVGLPIERRNGYEKELSKIENTITDWIRKGYLD